MLFSVSGVYRGRWYWVDLGGVSVGRFGRTYTREGTYGYSPFSLGIVFVLMGLSWYLYYSLIFIFLVAAPGADTGSAETTGQAVLILLAPALLVLVLTYLRVWHKTNWWISAFSVSVLLIVSPLLLGLVKRLLRKGANWLDVDSAA